MIKRYEIEVTKMGQNYPLVLQWCTHALLATHPSLITVVVAVFVHARGLPLVSAGDLQVIQ